MGGEELQILGRSFGKNLDRSRETPVERQHRALRNVYEHQRLRRARYDDHPALDAPAVGSHERQIPAILADQTQHEGNDHRLADRMAPPRRQRLGKVETKAARALIEAGRHLELRGAGLRIPAQKLRKVGRVRVGKAGDEILDRGGVAVVAAEVEIHALAKAVVVEQHLEHAHDLGALLVDGRRVEIVDLVIERRPDRMRQRASVLDELVRA